MWYKRGLSLSSRLWACQQQRHDLVHHCLPASTHYSHLTNALTGWRKNNWVNQFFTYDVTELKIYIYIPFVCVCLRGGTRDIVVARMKKENSDHFSRTSFLLLPRKSCMSLLLNLGPFSLLDWHMSSNIFAILTFLSGPAGSSAPPCHGSMGTKFLPLSPRKQQRFLIPQLSHLNSGCLCPLS